MGTVYLGVSKTGRQVAIKVVKRQFTEDAGFAARFRSEVASARKVASFCTARVLDDGDAEDGRPYMVTDYIPGTPLSSQIAAYGPLEESSLVGLAFGVCAALAAIHAAGLVHRDLKPGNVILSMTGPRVIDFGIARALGGLTGPTLTGEVVGTPGWWAPEQLDGRPVTPATDVFSWGCLVAYAASGRHPFGDGDAMTVAYRILHEKPVLSGLPDPLDRLVQRAIDLDPAARPTAQELLLALIGGDSATDGPPTRVLEAMWDPPKNLQAPDGGPHLAPAPDRGRGIGPARPGGRAGLRRWRTRAVIGVVAVLALGTGLVLLAPWDRMAGRTATWSGEADTPIRANDIGRHIIVGDQGLQLLVSAPPACGKPVHANGERVDDLQACQMYWFVLNTGGTPIKLAGPLDLVDDTAHHHKMTRAIATDVAGVLGGPKPDRPDWSADIQPGQALTFGGEYTLPAERTAVALIGPVVTGGEPIRVYL